MRHVDRIFLFVAAAVATPAVAVVSCTVAPETYPPPNYQVTVVSSSGVSSSGHTTTGTTSVITGTGGAGAGDSLCGCALHIYGAQGTSSCNSCASAAAAPTGACASLRAACATCDDATKLVMISNCSQTGSQQVECMAGTLIVYPDFRALAECQCEACTTECGAATSSACTLPEPDAGAGGADAGDGG